MALTTGFFLVALLSTASCGPMGETTVCESSPNVLSSLGLGSLGLNLPPSLLLQLLSQTLIPGLPLNTGVGATTVCDSVPNLGLPVVQNYGVATPAQTTVCESASNVSPMNLPIPYGLNLPGYLNNLPAATTVCESATNAVAPIGLPLGLPGLGLPYPLAGLGLPLNGLGLPLNGLGLPLNGLGLPLNGLGLPLNGLGLPLNGLGVPLNGLGVPFNGLGRLAASPLGLPIL